MLSVELRLTCTQSKKKLRLKSSPLSTYLFVTVIKMLLPQYERMGTTGLFAIGDAAAMAGFGGGGEDASKLFFSSPSSIVKSLFFSSAMECVCDGSVCKLKGSITGLVEVRAGSLG